MALPDAYGADSTERLCLYETDKRVTLSQCAAHGCESCQAERDRIRGLGNRPMRPVGQENRTLAARTRDRSDRGGRQR